jgi:hypothetical protein
MENGEKSQSPDLLILPDGRMTRRDAARYLGLSEKTLAMYASRKTGPRFVKPGRTFYFKEDLDAWIRGETGEK